MSRIGIVLEAQADRAVLQTSRRGICDTCAQKSECSFESALGKDVPEQVVAKNPIKARPGDLVEFDLEGRAELKLSFLVWIVPLIGLVAGAIIGAALHQRIGLAADPAAFIGALAGFIVFFLPLIAYDRLMARDQSLIPVIKRITKEACEISTRSP